MLRHLEIPVLTLNLQDPLLRLSGRHPRQTGGSFHLALPSGDKHCPPRAWDILRHVSFNVVVQRLLMYKREATYVTFMGFRIRIA